MVHAFKEKILRPVLHLIYPHLCAGCYEDFLNRKDLICYKCVSTLPFTGFADHPENPVEQVFWGRVNCEAASAEFYFTKDSIMQHLIYEMKYKENKKLGVHLGKLMGENLKQSGRFQDVDAIIPLPLHKKKLKQRGFNQAALLGEGISQVMNKPLILNQVIRRRATETQTRKHRIDRWENVKDGFTVLDPDSLSGKHLLLVDDVLTTGATMESCAIEILKIPDVRLSLALLAITRF